MQKKVLTLTNNAGLHTRASASFVSLAGRFRSQIQLASGGKTVDGKSIMAVMGLAAKKDDEITIQVDGEDADAALLALSGLVQDQFGE